MLLWIAIGGALGAVARYAVTGWVHARTGADLPWGTFVVNASGSFLLGVLLRWADLALVAPQTRALLVTGILGAFTTFSTFSYETVALLQDREWARAGLYSLGSVLLGVAAVLAGTAFVDVWVRLRG